MVHDVVIFRIRHMHDRVVTRSVGDIEILPQDLPDTIERAKRRIGDGVSDLVIRSGPTTLTPHEVIFTILLKHKRAFHAGMLRLYQTKFRPAPNRQLPLSPKSYHLYAVRQSR